MNMNFGVEEAWVWILLALFSSTVKQNWDDLFCRVTTTEDIMHETLAYVVDFFHSLTIIINTINMFIIIIILSKCQKG